MVDLGQKKVELSAFFYAQNSRGGERVCYTGFSLILEQALVSLNFYLT